MVRVSYLQYINFINESFNNYIFYKETKELHGHNNYLKWGKIKSSQKCMIKRQESDDYKEI